MHIVLEGLPGSGKTTLATRMAHEAGYVKIDEMLVPIPETGDEFLYVEHDVAKTSLSAQHTNTVMDRSYLSTLGYNYANDRHTGANNFKSIKQRIDNELANGRLRNPDLVIYLQTPIATSLERQNPTNAAFWRDTEMLRFSEEYILNYLKQSYEGDVVYVDGTQSADEVYALAMNSITQRQKQVVYGR